MAQGASAALQRLAKRQVKIGRNPGRRQLGQQRQAGPRFEQSNTGSFAEQAKNLMTRGGGFAGGRNRVRRIGKGAMQIPTRKGRRSY